MERRKSGDIIIGIVYHNSCRIGLLWYHTIIRPFFALDGEEEDAGSGEATRLLDEALARYPSSALFLYFRYIDVT